MIQDRALSRPPTKPISLLSVPAEIRNSIYEYALVERGVIQITSGLLVPALLSTCRQIRSEAYKIWLTDNNFRLAIESFDGKLAAAWAQLLFDHGARKGPAILCSPSQNWSNILLWCEIVHSRGMTLTMSDDSKASKFNAILHAALSVAARCQSVSWSECKKTLESLRSVLANYDEGWL